MYTVSSCHWYGFIVSRNSSRGSLPLDAESVALTGEAEQPVAVGDAAAATMVHRAARGGGSGIDRRAGAMRPRQWRAAAVDFACCTTATRFASARAAVAAATARRNRRLARCNNFFSVSERRPFNPETLPG